jgi:hypothetical protein
MIGKNNEEIKEIKKRVEEIHQTKLPEDDEYIKKYQAEKKVHLDKVCAKRMRKLCYGKKFTHLYQAKLMKMIFESVLLEKIEDEINLRYANKTRNYSSDENKLLKIREDIIKEVTFEFYKKLCFDSWRFKNQVLACNEFIIVSVEGGRKEDYSLRKIMDILDELRIESDKHKTKDDMNIFWPLIDTLMVIVYLSIIYKRSKQHRDEHNKVKNIYKYIVKRTIERERRSE